MLSDNLLILQLFSDNTSRNLKSIRLSPFTATVYQNKTPKLRPQTQAEPLPIKLSPAKT